MKYVLLCIGVLLCGTTLGQTLVIHFDFDKYELTPAARASIDSFLSAEQQKLPAMVRLSGHCDFIGSNAYNDRLSIKRAEQVKEYLKANDPRWVTDLSMMGFGEKKPLNDNSTVADRSLNRRVEISIIQNSSSTNTDSANKKSPGKTKDVSLKKQIADTAVKSGSFITLKNINFEGGRHVFLPEAYPVLEELLETMNAYPSLTIEIRGHICCLGGDVDGLDADTRTYSLSEERAKAVYSYLISHGIKAERLAYKGYGHSFPIYAYPEQTEEERIANRRVEIKIVSK